MPTLTFNDRTYSCARAMKGADFIRLLNDKGDVVFFADGITDFTPYALTGTWETAQAAQAVAANAALVSGVLVLTPLASAKIETGVQITFVAPCDSAEIRTVSIGGVNYAVVDANEKSVSSPGSFWVNGSTVTLTLNCENKKAYMPSPVPDPTYNKTEILTDETKTQFGFGATAVPNDVFAYLAKYNMHCWSKKSNAVQYVLKEADDTALTIIADVLDSTTWRTFYYGDSVAMDSSGKLSLVNEATGRCRYYGMYETEPSNITGKYISLDKTTFFRVVDGYVRETYRNVSAGQRRYTIGVRTHVVYSERQTAGTTDYVSSTNRNAYPDNADSSGFRYNYMGVPLMNALGSMRYEMGSYVGTGSYGSANPKKLTLSFTPKVVIVIGGNDARLGNSGYGFIYIGQPGDLNFTVSGNSLSWYATNAETQYNTSGQTFYYFALG